MQLSITDAALEKLNSLGIDNQKILLLWYDREGLGCVVNGQPTIRFTDTVDETNFKEVENPHFKTYVDREYDYYFDENMTLNFVNGRVRRKF